jgi:CubicO group peptidase (beta-lactamase class C family)
VDLSPIAPFIHEKMAESRLPGLSIALVQGEETIFRQSFGFRDLERGLPATPQTLFCIGSVTKSFTALAIMQLAEAGKLDLEDPVETFFPFPIRPMGE